MAEMGWLNPVAWWHLAWLLPLLGLLVAVAAWRRRRRLAELCGGGTGGVGLQTTLSPGRRRLRRVLLLAAVVLVVAALARPYWGLRLLPFSAQGRDVMIVLDVSRSMLADDLKPSRLDHAKWLLRELIKATPGDRFGIVAFAGDAFLQCPLTIDRNSLFMYLDELSPGSIPLGGTNLERALLRAVAAFAAAGGGHRAVLLLTDGDELAGNSRRVLAEFSKRNLPLLVVGLGDPAGTGLIPIPAEDGRSRTLLRDRQGQLVVSRLAEDALRNLALGTPNGMYLRSTVTDSGLDQLRRRIHELVPEAFAQGQRQRPIERFPLPLAAAVLLLLARLAIGERRPVPTPVLAGLLWLLLPSWPIPAQAAGDDQALLEPDAVELPATDSVPQEALAMPAPPTTASPSPPPLVQPAWREYNQALEQQEADRLEEARNGYERAINLAVTRPEIRARAYRNLGVAAHRAGRAALAENPEQALRELAVAENLYREALRAGPETVEIARNQQLLLSDRRQAETRLEQLRQLREQQQQAAEQTRQAHDAQQQANAQTQDQQQANAQTEQARQAVEKFRQAAEQAQHQPSQQTAAQAAEALREAATAQRQNDGQTAEQQLARAMQLLGANQQEQEPASDQPPAAGGNEQQPRQNPSQPPKRPDQQPPPDQLPQPPPDQPPPSPENQPDINPDQAEALLDLMAREESDLREAIRERMRRDAQLKPVEKDW